MSHYFHYLSPCHSHTPLRSILFGEFPSLFSGEQLHIFLIYRLPPAHRIQDARPHISFRCSVEYHCSWAAFCTVFSIYRFKASCRRSGQWIETPETPSYIGNRLESPGRLSACSSTGQPVASSHICEFQPNDLGDEVVVEPLVSCCGWRRSPGHASNHDRTH